MVFSPVVPGYPSQVTCTGAGLWAKTSRRLLAVCSFRSTRCRSGPGGSFPRPAHRSAPRCCATLHLTPHLLRPVVRASQLGITGHFKLLRSWHGETTAAERKREA